MNKNHPIFNLNKFLLKPEPRLILEFSRYIYLSYGVTFSREVFHVKASDIEKGWLENQIDLLSDEQELALHSRVKLHEDDNVIYHLPLIDFINKSKENVISKVLPINKLLNNELFLYESGNSYHGYYFQLLTVQEWYKFLGKILLCNPPSKFNEEIVDSRWVGHSLEHEFSALRWSKRTEKYKLVPTFTNVNDLANGDLTESTMFENIK